MRGASKTKLKSCRDARPPRLSGQGEAHGKVGDDLPCADQRSPEIIRPGGRGRQGAKRATVSRQKKAACEPLRGRNDGALCTSANATDLRTGPNPHWLARAKLFELPGKLCKRGHDISKEGVYLVPFKRRKGGPGTIESCRRCRIEDVQTCVAKKKLREARARSFKRAA